MEMSATARRYTLAEYFEIERNSLEKHEYRDGIVVPVGEALAMAGGSFNHSLIAANVAREIGNRLKGSPCRVFESNLRVRIPRKTLFAYPDVSVICGKAEFDSDVGFGETVVNPRLIVEVLSPSSELYDRGQKFERYRELDSLTEYVLVSQDTALVESYFRQPDGTWLFSVNSGLDSAVKLRSVDIHLPLSEVYAGLEFRPDAATRAGPE
jgi:Uma2 family endonuclease